MESSRRSNPQSEYLTTTNIATTPPPAGLIAPGIPSMFHNAHNTHIENGSFHITANFNAVNRHPLHELHKRVAANAILNAGGRADEPKCHPGTREEVIARIENWRDAKDSSTAPIFWLSRPAGAGKSAIVQTISKRCDEHKAPHANFFFFRTDSSRTQVSPLIATLVYQLIALHPPLSDYIATLLFNDPLIIDLAVKDQLVQLILAPLRTIQQLTPDYRPVVFLIDGLDECDSETKRGQRQILDAFDAILTENPQGCPFRLLVASRNESQIQLAFNRLSSTCMHLYLDHNYSSSGDIRTFVNAEFKKVRETHPLRDILDANWPPTKDVDYIVQKSSGQFIYAATVMRFISGSLAVPTISLERIKGTTRFIKKSPFSDLDAIYLYILMQVDDQETLKDILSVKMLMDSLAYYEMSTKEFLEWYNQTYTEAVVLSCLAHLTPIVQFYKGNLRFYHASFSDFLLDQLRSGEYFVDISAFNYKALATLCTNFADLSTPVLPALFGFGSFFRKAVMQLNRLPPKLLKTLVSFSQCIPDSDADVWRKIHELCATDDDMAKFRNIFRHWIRAIYGYKHWNIIKDVPFAPRYSQMADNERIPTRVPDGTMTAALRPESDFDRHESALWLKDLLHDIHQGMFGPIDPAHYRTLLKAWTLWAVQNDIPLHRPGDGPYVNAISHDSRKTVDVPHARRYFAMALIDHNLATLPSADLTAALDPETDDDRHELALWLQDVLCRIKIELYSSDPKCYKKAVKGWISWAICHDICCHGLDDLPGASSYIRRERLKKRAAGAFKIGGSIGGRK